MSLSNLLSIKYFYHLRTLCPKKECATVTLPFSLNDKTPTNVLFSPAFDYTYNDKTIEFTFNSPTPKTEKVTLKFEDKEFSFGYMNTPTGHAYFAYKWKYNIDINFVN